MRGRGVVVLNTQNARGYALQTHCSGGRDQLLEPLGSLVFCNIKIIANACSDMLFASLRKCSLLPVKSYTVRGSRCRCWTRARQRAPSLPQTSSAGTCPCSRSSSRDPGRALPHQAASTCAVFWSSGARMFPAHLGTVRFGTVHQLAHAKNWMRAGGIFYSLVLLRSLALEKIVLHHSDSSWLGYGSSRVFETLCRRSF